MKNINYDLVKLLHVKMDTIWRLENYYIQDAQEVQCHSLENLKKILEDEKRHVQMLTTEIGMRCDAKVFD